MDKEKEKCTENKSKGGGRNKSKGALANSSQGQTSGGAEDIYAGKTSGGTSVCSGESSEDKNTNPRPQPDVSEDEVESEGGAGEIVRCGNEHHPQTSERMNGSHPCQVNLQCDKETNREKVSASDTKIKKTENEECTRPPEQLHSSAKQMTGKLTRGEAIPHSQDSILGRCQQTVAQNGSKKAKTQKSTAAQDGQSSSVTNENKMAPLEEQGDGLPGSMVGNESPSSFDEERQQDCASRNPAAEFKETEVERGKQYKSTLEKGEHSENHEEKLIDPNKYSLMTQKEVGTPTDNTAGVPSIADRSTSSISRLDEETNTYGEELKRFTGDDSFPETDDEKTNILRIFKLMYGLGLSTLRKLFLGSHSAWTHQPKDAAGLDRWKMKLQRHEDTTFKTGKIDDWDFSLMTKVLLFSKCNNDISKKPDHVKALESLRDHRNKLIGHPSTYEMSTKDFNTYWPILSSDLKTLGADPDEIEEILEDEVLISGKYYRELFLSELAASSHHAQRLDKMDQKLDILIASKDCKPAAQLLQFNEGGQKWDEWINFRQSLRDFNFSQNQYILIADAQSKEDRENYTVLRSVPWKMVLDLDPESEERGFYREFTSKEDQSCLISMLTPTELRKCSSGSLPRQIDAHKTQWLFTNGRASDTVNGAQTFPDWEATSVKQISKLFNCCSDPDKFDKSKPVVCLFLPFRNENWKFLDVTLQRLKENFDEFDVTFVSFHHENCHLISESYEVQVHDLSAELLVKGLSNLFDLSASQGYRMPTSLAEIPVTLSKKQYLYLDEYMDVLYDGCEDIPQDSTKLEELSNEHRKSFMAGNWISFTSLHLSHDAKRELANDLQIHIQRLLDQGLKHSVIVEIRHLPGTGGSTIARRVLWDLHKSYPCAFIRPNACPNNEDVWLGSLVSRIKTLEEICNTSPLILIDDGHVRTEGLTNKLVRALNNIGKRALLLRCRHGTKDNTGAHQSQAFHVHKVFIVNVKLRESIPDYNEFQSKYKDFIEESSAKRLNCNPCRVFHFPLMALIEDFHPKLREIVHSTMEQMQWLEQEVVVLVAFIQKYANQATPAPLLYEAFKQHISRPNEKRKSITYDDIRSFFSDDLLNLMVPVRPRKHPHVTARLIDSPPERYTLQHPIVAEMVLQKSYQDQQRDLFAVAKQFLQFPIYQCEEFLPLFQDLFIHNIYGEVKLKFSVLFAELQDLNAKEAAAIFCQAAEKTNDPHIYAHAARFHAKKKPPSFVKAKELIEKALSKERGKPLLDTKGVILHIELKHKINRREVPDLATLQTLAGKSLASFQVARAFPPTYPNPLIGEVRVWLTCIGWIMNNILGGDSDKTFKFITGKGPAFFRTCIGDSFRLLDVVDEIVYSVATLKDPEETQKLANHARLSLMKTFNKGRHPRSGRRDNDDIVQACKDLCSSETFPKLSKKELKRIRAHYILSFQDETLKQRDLRYLLELLSDLVLVEKELPLAYHLMKVCVLVTGPQHYTLEQGLRVTGLWLKAGEYNYLPYFYEMAICFLKILDGETLEYTARYNKAHRNCKEKSKNHCRSTISTHYVGKEGSGMSRLVTRSILLQGETDYSAEVNKFWTIDSRKKLLECKGRIRSRPGYRGREQPYIELIQGNVELHVAKNVFLGKAERDYTTGSLVYFVASFNLNGPVANGITFTPSNDVEQEAQL